MIMRLVTPHREVMLCTRVDSTEVETHHPTIPSMGSSQDGSTEVLV